MKTTEPCHEIDFSRGGRTQRYNDAVGWSLLTDELFLRDFSLPRYFKPICYEAAGALEKTLASYDKRHRSNDAHLLRSVAADDGTYLHIRKLFRCPFLLPHLNDLSDDKAGWYWRRTDAWLTAVMGGCLTFAHSHPKTAFFGAATKKGQKYRDLVSTATVSKDGVISQDVHEYYQQFGYHLSLPDELSGGELPGMPKLIGMGCVRNRLERPLFLILVDDIVSRLSQEDIELLMQAAYVKTAPKCLDCTRDTRISKTRILSMKDGHYQMAYYHSSTLIDAEASHQRALNNLRTTVEAMQGQGPAQMITLKPGDFLLINNHRALLRGQREDAVSGRKKSFSEFREKHLPSSLGSTDRMLRMMAA